jgi:endonuclease YncB( thermonuclease family)
MKWVVCFLILSAALFAKHTYGNLVVETVKRVHDGDTFIADIADVHPIIGKGISIRIKGIDSPEITDKRPDVKALAIEAREYVKARLSGVSRIELNNIGRDKYFRILADVYVDGVNLAEELLEEGLAVPYHGKTRPEW